MRSAFIRTIFVSALVVLLLSQRHCGFMLVFVLFVLIPSFAYSGYRCACFPVERKLRLQKVIVWCVAVAVIVAVHLVRHQTAKTYAQGVSEKIETYISVHGRCPAGLEDVGISRSAFKENLGMGGYRCENQAPFLFYASTYVPFDTENYDFVQREWRHVYD